MVACMSLPETPSQRGEKNSTPEMPEQCSLDNEVASICRDRPEVLEVLQDVMTQQNWESDGHYRGRKAFVLRVIKTQHVGGELNTDEVKLLSGLYNAVKYLGCTYSDETMNLLAKYDPELVRRHREEVAALARKRGKKM